MKTMKPFFSLILTILFSCVSINGQVKTPAKNPLDDGKTFKDSLQAVVVTTEDWNTIGGKLSVFERKSKRAKWQKVGETIDVVVGKKGLGWGAGLHDAKVFLPDQPVKREGDGKSPAGIFRLTSAFGSAPPSEVAWLKMPYTFLEESTECVDDVKSGKYNLIVDKNKVGDVDWNSSEKMLAVGAEYEYGVFVAHNSAPRTSGKGSCIFLHVWKNETTGTAGCSAMEREDILTLLRRLDAAKTPVLIQLPKAEYARLEKSWKLPKLQ